MTMTPSEMLEAAMDGSLDVNALDKAETPEAKTEPQEQPADAGQTSDGDTNPPSAAGSDDPPAGQEPEGAPIASKSGHYTIPFQRLADARSERDQWRAKAEQLEQQLQTLAAKPQANIEQAEQAAQARADAGQSPTQADKNLQAAKDAVSQGVDPAVFGDFSEEGIAKGLTLVQQQFEARINQRLDAHMQAMQEKLAAQLEPLRQREQQSAAHAHQSAILAAHPDAVEVVESAQFQKWRESLPSFMRAGVSRVLESGNTQEVIEVFDSFKQAGGSKPTGKGADAQPVAPSGTPANAPRRVPASLSEVAGAAPSDDTQQMLQMAGDPASLLDRMSSMTPEQIEALMSRV